MSAGAGSPTAQGLLVEESALRSEAGSVPEATPRAAAVAPEGPAWWWRLLDPRQPFLVPLVLLLGTRAYFWKLMPFAGEDAYITYRYARNLALGYGLVYNPGERVMGFSSPLWTVWNALGYLLLRDPVTWSRVTTVTLEAVALVLMGSMLLRHAGRASAWCFTLFFATWTYFGAVAASGMENTAMFALMVIAATLAERKSWTSGPAIAAVALMRPEGPAAALILALLARTRDRIVAGALLAAALLAIGSYFGTLVPQSVLAKATVYGVPGAWEGRHWWEWIFPFPMGNWPSTSEGSILFAFAILAGPALVLGAVSAWKKRETALAHVLAAAVAVWIGYIAMGVAYFYWYLAVPLAGVAGLVAWGLPQMVKGRAVYAGLLLFIAGTWTLAPELYRARAQAEWRGFGAVAEFLVGHARGGEKVLLEPIGMVGWRCRLIVRDEIGLVTPQAAARRLQGAGWLTDLVAAERPEWIVMRQGVLREAKAFAGAGDPFRAVAERDSLLSRYRTATVIEPQAGDGALAVLRRKDAGRPGGR